MWKCSIIDSRIRIDGCPPNGIPAIDFRLGHGLPAEPIDDIFIPGHSWYSEGLVREYPELADAAANLASNYCQFRLEMTFGRIERHWLPWHVFLPYASSGVLAAYMADPSDATGEALLCDMIALSRRDCDERLAKLSAEADDIQGAGSTIHLVS